MNLTRVNSNDHPELYQLIGPIEELYQLVPIGQIDVSSDYVNYQLIGPIHAINDAVFYNLELSNQLEAPIQLLAIEGTPQFQLVGPVPRLARIRCRFANDSHRLVDLVWTDNNHRMYRYAKLAHTDFIDITTFEGHQWVFCDALDGELNSLNPGGVKKFIASVHQNSHRRRLRVSAISSVEGLTLKRIILRLLASKIVDHWNSTDCCDCRSIGLFLESLRLPICIQVQLANFLISCILYQFKFDSNRSNIGQKRLFDGLPLIHFLFSFTALFMLNPFVSKIRFSKDELDKILRDADEQRDFPALLRSLGQLAFRPTDGFSLPSSALSQMASHFASLSPFSAFHWANGLFALLPSAENHANSEVLIVSLLRSLVDNVPLLNANKLRAFVKTEISRQCVSFWQIGKAHLASALTLCVLRILLMELSYLEAIQNGVCRVDLIAEAQNIWSQMLSADELLKVDPGAFLRLSSSLFHSALGLDYPLTNPLEANIVVCLKKCSNEMGSQNGLGKCDSLYCASLFDLLSAHLATFCQILPGDVCRAIFEFLIAHSERDNLEILLKQLAKNSAIRCGECCEKVFRSLCDLPMPSPFNLEEIWSIETKSSGKKETQAQKIDESQLSWASLLSLSDECLANSLVGVSNAKIESIVLSADFAVFQPEICLRLLISLMKIKRTLVIPFRCEFVHLILAEEAPKSRSLEFGAKLLEMHAHSADSDAFPVKSDFVSFCLAIFQPIDQLDCDQCAKRDFLLAELSFLRALFSVLPHLLTSFAPLIVQLLPDFFVSSNFYRRTLREWPESRFADRLEHSLALLCREIVRRKKCFNKLLPFVISSSLTGDRELCFPMYLLFSALDENDLALLSSNLSAAEKLKFSRLKVQFYASNKIIG
ncbi:hypothetical protein niasHT_001844 [Heterodera trifolii]|uniref:von Hippel-Lindau disease tumour suppressor beta domain-containing protein n=1 Tax=Heterodera trifolii TaxID=157864 RepID=A0ABD2MBS0_9BILA